MTLLSFLLPYRVFWPRHQELLCSPGAVPTDMGGRVISFIPSLKDVVTDSPNLSAWTYVRLTSGSEDWLSGRFVDCTANLDELNKSKERIVEQDALKNRLALPV